MPKSLQVLCLATLLMLLLMQNARATNYYIKAGGNDTAIGTSAARAWKTCNPLYSYTLLPGDSVLFKGGDTLFTHFYCAPADSGTPSKPVYFGSYGKGRAVIYTDTFYCFFLYNNGGYVFDNLEMMGSGYTTNKSSGFFYYSDKGARHTHYFLKLNRLFIHHFGADGIEIYDYDSAYYGLSDISISYCNLTDNGNSGLSTVDMAGWTDKLYGIKNLRVSYCNALRNNTNGIVIGGADSATIEHCLAAYTGVHNNKGTAGIWAWSSRNVVIQYCISHDIKTTGSDGEGYDLDGGTNHCIIQYSYSYNNDDLGYMHCDYPYSRPTHHNTIRYCLSQNDGRKRLKGGFGFLFISWGSGIDSCLMYNNDVYMPDNDSGTVSGFGGYILNGYDSGVHIRHCRAFNNIIYVDGIKNNYLVWCSTANHPLADTNLLFLGNNYYSSNSNSHRWLVNNKTYYSLQDWHSSAQQEHIGAYRMGDTLNPVFANAGKAPNLNNTDSLIYISAYKYGGISHMINAGLNLDSLFGINIGRYDFYGNKPQRGSHQDIGMYEYPYYSSNIGVQKPLNNIKIFPNPAKTFTEVDLSAYSRNAVLTIYDLNGKLFESIILSGTHHTVDISHLPAGVYVMNIITETYNKITTVIKY